MLGRVLVTRHAVTVPQVDVDVVPGVPRLTPAHQTLPLGRGQLGVPVLRQVVLVAQFVRHHDVTLNVAPVSEHDVTQPTLELKTVQGVLVLSIGRSPGYGPGLHRGVKLGNDKLPGMRVE